jgi:DNA-binding NarL/FixJ family response regulator
MQSLLTSLGNTFRSVRSVRSLQELRNSIARQRAEIVIVDVESIPFSEVEHLSQEFPQVCIVCTHRLADEEMWTAALSAGAADICPSGDTSGIVTAALRNVSMTRSAAA